MRRLLLVKSFAIAAIVGISGLSAAQSSGKPSAGIAAATAASNSSAGAAQATNADAGYRIAGVVVSKADGHPLVRARVAIASVKDRAEPEYVITSDDGKFEFKGLAEGKYSLSWQKRGFISASYEQHDQYSTAIVTGAGFDTENLVLKLAPDAVLTGKVLDESGDPVRNAAVTVYYNDHSQGVDQIHTYRTAQTDDLGVYEVTPLRPGTYYVSANAKPWYATASTASGSDSSKDDAARGVDPALDVAYSLTYYPDVTDAESAMPIPIQGGERVQVDIHLNPVPSLRVFIHVSTDSPGGAVFPSIQASALDGFVPIQPDAVRQASTGVWEITGIPAGRYNIHLQGQGAQSAELDSVDLTKDGESINASTAAAASDVKVAVQVQGEALPKQLTVGLRAGSRPVAWARVDEKGETELENVPAGKYEFVIWGNAKRYSIVQIGAEGAEVVGHTVTLTTGASPSVALTLVGGNAQIQGIVKKAGKGAAGAMVVLVPKNAEGNRDLFRRDQSDLDGTFTLNGVVPGSYTVLAIENGWDLDWSQPEVIAAYLKRGRKIEVGGQLIQPLKLPEAIEVQSK